MIKGVIRMLNKMLWREVETLRQRKTHSQPMGKKEKQNWRQEKYYKPLLDTNVSHRTARQQRAYDGGVGG